MIADENRIKARLFRKACEIEKFPRSELLGRRLVSKSKHAGALSRAPLAGNLQLLVML
jgi:hypothetical protein